jgi:DNA-binding NarL/FixJ family response regulator
MEIQMHSLFIFSIAITLIIGLLIIVVFLYLKLRIAVRSQIKNALPNTIKPLFRVTPREKEVLSLICNGFSNKEIAAKLSISEQTVKNYVSALMEKSRTRSRTQLAIMLMKLEVPVK